MAYLVLNEAFRVVELDQVGHVGVAERVQVQFSGQARFLAGVVERSVDRPQRETSSSLGEEQRRVARRLCSPSTT